MTVMSECHSERKRGHVESMHESVFLVAIECHGVVGV